MSDTSLPPPLARFPGVQQALYPQSEPGLKVDEQELEDDLEGEQQTLSEEYQDGAPPHDDEQQPIDVDAPDGVDIDAHRLAFIQQAVTGIAKGISDATEAEYRRLATQCKAFLVAEGLLKPSEPFFCKEVHPYADYFIILWIMASCDRLRLDGTIRDDNPHSYSTAEKMRAAMTWIFGHLYGLGSMPWHESAGQKVGNPSVSPLVSRYMVSLRKRKTRAGESATSARALTVEKLYHMYHYNMNPKRFPMSKYNVQSVLAHCTPRKSRDKDLWAGPRQRRMLNLIYILAFLCLLRSDEVLNIRLEDFERDPDNEDKITLTLRHRKTAQYGNVEPFVLWRQPEHLRHLCPVTALNEWLNASKITSGYLFRRFPKDTDLVVSDSEHALSSDAFLEMYRNNLIDIKVDPTPYGTHSFRRGGCQYYIVHRRWNIRKLCEWGGWSREFDNLTIVKYIISWNDDPLNKREDFLNPNIKPTLKCHVCGRSCPCA